jgi:hypothetical protein
VVQSPVYLFVGFLFLFFSFFFFALVCFSHRISYFCHSDLNPSTYASIVTEFIGVHH